MSKFTKSKTRNTIVGAALALSIPLAACGGGNEPTQVVSNTSAAAPAPMSAVEEMRLIEGLVLESSAQPAATAPMSAVQELNVIRELADQAGDTTSTGWYGVPHQYR